MNKSIIEQEEAINGEKIIFFLDIEKCTKKEENMVFDLMFEPNINLPVNDLYF